MALNQTSVDIMNSLTDEARGGTYDRMYVGAYSSTVTVGGYDGGDALDKLLDDLVDGGFDYDGFDNDTGTAGSETDLKEIQVIMGAGQWFGGNDDNRPAIDTPVYGDDSEDDYGGLVVEKDDLPNIEDTVDTPLMMHDVKDHGEPDFTPDHDADNALTQELYDAPLVVERISGGAGGKGKEPKSKVQMASFDEVSNFISGYVKGIKQNP
jgi:hypothetical protein